MVKHSTACKLKGNSCQCWFVLSLMLFSPSLHGMQGLECSDGQPGEQQEPNPSATPQQGCGQQGLRHVSPDLPRQGAQGKSPARPHNTTAVQDPASISRAMLCCHCSSQLPFPGVQSPPEEHVGRAHRSTVQRSNVGAVGPGCFPLLRIRLSSAGDATAEHIFISAKARAP